MKKELLQQLRARVEEVGEALAREVPGHENPDDSYTDLKAKPEDAEIEALAMHMWLGMQDAPEKPMDAVKYAQARLKKLSTDKATLQKTFRLMNRTGKAVAAARGLVKMLKK